MEEIIPDELKGLLFDFVLNLKMDNPSDVLQYAANHFNQKAIEKRNDLIKKLNGSAYSSTSGRRTSYNSPRSSTSDAGTSHDNPRSSTSDDGTSHDNPRSSTSDAGTSHDNPRSSTSDAGTSHDNPRSSTSGAGISHDNLNRSRTETDVFFTELEEEENIAGASSRRMSIYEDDVNPEDESDDEKIIYHKTDEQNEFLKRTLKELDFFSELEESQLTEVIDSMIKREIRKGDIVMCQGDEGDYFYVIQSGNYDIFLTPQDGISAKYAGTYNNEGYFGHLALLYNQPRAATIEATTDGILWGLNRSTFRKLLVKSSYKIRKEYDNFLKSVDMLQCLTENERIALCDAVVTKTFNDEVIFKENDEVDGMYFVLEGKARVSKINKDTGEDQVLDELKRGNYFGELSLVTKRGRFATVTAVGIVRTAFIHASAFERLLGSYLSFMARNIEKFSEEVNKTAQSDRKT